MWCSLGSVCRILPGCQHLPLAWLHGDDEEVPVHAFRAAVEAKNIDDIGSLLSESVTFHSPVAFHPYEGRETVAAILRTAFETFEDFEYVRELDSPLDGYTGLVFTAKVDGLDVQGCDFIHQNPDREIDEFTVMLRPMKATHAFADKMGEKLEAVLGSRQ